MKKKKLLEVQTFVNYIIPYVLLCPCLLQLHCNLNAEKHSSDKKGSSYKRSVDDAEESNAVKRFCKKKWIIHCTDDSSDLVNPKDEESWKTSLRAAQIRNHQEIVQLSKSLRDGEVSLIYYHRKCRNIFTICIR